MPLTPLQPDREPTDAELQPYLVQVQSCPERIRHNFAALLWRTDKMRQDPNLFHVAYSVPWPGYKHYADLRGYLASREWKAIRRSILQAVNYHCCCCDERATQVHHRDYRPRVLAGEDPTALVALCEDHHDQIEVVRKKESWQQSEWLLAELVEQHESVTRIQ